MPSITGYHHLSLSVRDLATSIRWYGEVLGFQVDSEFEGPGFRRARLRGPEPDLTLTLTCHDHQSGDRFSELRTGMDHVAFLVSNIDDLHAWKQRFEDLGVEHSEIKPTARGTGALITVRDPDNVQIEVFHPGP